jgi:large subunit ribosomal protein L15
MQLHTLKRHTKRKTSTQVGRGGKRGKTSGRGTKGQNARAGRKKRPELRDIIKKIPKMRGRGKNSFKAFRTKATVVNLSELANVVKAGDTINPAFLVEKNIIQKINGRTPSVKILGNGEIAVAVNVSGCTVSSSAKAAIEKAGGKIA